MALEIKILPEIIQPVEELKAHTELYYLQLISSYSTWKAKQVGFDVDLSFNIQTMVKPEYPMVAEDGPYFTAGVLVDLQALDSERTECFIAQVAYKTQYELDGQITPSIETMNWFAQTVALADVWPYARELIIGLSIKTDVLLPPMPMLRFLPAEDAPQPYGLRFIEEQRQKAEEAMQKEKGKSSRKRKKS